MTTSKLQTLIAQAADLSYEDLIALNKSIVALARQKHRASSAAQTAKFVPGQIIRFYKSGSGRHAGIHYARVTGYNRAGTCLVGFECDSTGKDYPTPIKWTVAASHATLHTTV